MYKAFNFEAVAVASISKALNDEFYAEGKSLYADIKDKARKNLSALFGPGGVLQAEKVFENWFPEVDADIFISHSHKDEEAAIKLAAFFKRFFGLNVFVDSCVWGYADLLLKEIDNKYCKNSDGTYSYEDRNISTSHIHMMLSSSLLKMMDKCEVVMFLNTPSSMSAENEIKEHVVWSPWIFSELSAVSFLRERIPQRRMSLRKSMAFDRLFESRNDSALVVEYPASLRSFESLSLNDLLDWIKGCTESQSLGQKALDVLYDKKGL